MKLLKSISTIATLILLMVIAADIQADQGQTNETEDGGIMTGLVIAYGEILKPPYYFTYNLDTLYINGVRIRPPKGDPNRIAPEKPVMKPTEESRLQHNLIKEMSRIYYETYKKHGIEKAEKKLLEKYKNHELLDEFEIRDGDAYLRFKGEKYGEWNMLKSNLPYFGGNYFTPEMKTRQSIESIKMWKDFLKMGMTIACCYDQHDWAYHKDKTDKMLELIDKVEKSAISKSEANREVRAILGNCIADELWIE